MAPRLLELRDKPLSAALDGGQGWTSNTTHGGLGVNYTEYTLCCRRVITDHDSMSTKPIAGLSNQDTYERHFSLFMNGYIE